MGKKNLDKLFQEKLKDFSELPDDKVWESIETSLDKKKKSRKVIPVWWKLGGVAAVLAIGFFLLSPFENNLTTDPAVTNANGKIENESEGNSPKKDTEQLIETPASNQNQIVVTEDKQVGDVTNVSADKVVNSSNTDITNLKSNVSDKTSDDVVSSILNSQVVAYTPKETQPNILDRQISADETDVLAKKESNINTAVATYDEEQTSSATTENKKNVDAIISNNANTADTNKAVVQSSGEILEEKEDLKKKSIFDEIAAQQQEESAVTENTGSKWSAGPSIAPVYFDAIGQGSPVHSIFVPNSKSGDVNLSYGLTVAYEVSKKLSIRSGIHKVDYGYNTDDVQFSSSLDAAASSQIDNVDYAVTARNLVVSSKTRGSVEALNQNPFLDTSSEVSATTTSRDGIMEQQLGYVEVPVELNYSLLDKKFGINLIGGVSSLFLVDNSIQLTSGELTTEVGEANNVNSVNFSTNVGFGINYKFTPKVKLNIEPMFKYQLNTFSRTEGTFQPFSVGVYSGLSFKF